ncbi:MAG TPA: type I-C CRISPR-associated protein Cas8c/Csd1 [Actinobacteria bacterium]|nr:type I-C CRISPR-associated protein Cas8c/Csd1 [Actinomycetota bacterium]
MIIQALNAYYERLKQNANSDIPDFGFSNEKIHFALVLDSSGKLVDVRDLREREGKKNVPKLLEVPSASKKTSGIDPNFMWGNTGYVLGADSKEHKDKDRPYKMFKEFKNFQHTLGDKINDIGMNSVLKFLDSWQPAEAIKLTYWEEMSGTNVVFKLDNENKYIHEHSSIREEWVKYYQNNQSDYKAFCLVSGQRSPIARLHQSIKGVKNAQSSGASIVSFNQDSFCSYNKEQSFNAPVSEKIVFNYTTVLNQLLRFNSRQNIQIGDASTVFWAEEETPMEGFLKDVLDPQDSQINKGNIRRFLEAIREGKMPKDIENTRNMKFYILGLSPNAGRLSVRFWYINTVEDICNKIGQHFKDLSIAKNYEEDPEFPGMWHLLRELAPQREIDRLSPLLAGLFMRAILTGERYPSNLLSIIINRIRAEQSSKNKITGKPVENVTYLRASMIKAYLVRNNRIRNSNEREVVGMVLNKEEKNIGYRLGRLFAVLEKAQKDAVPGANSTIKDRYYGSASSTPVIVFPQLLSLAQHHIQKSDYGANTDKNIESILQDIRKFPAHLSLEDQGMFALGYYHQKQDFYKKSEKKEE